jgi:hypothetical protein
VRLRETIVILGTLVLACGGDGGGAGSVDGGGSTDGEALLCPPEQAAVPSEVDLAGPCSDDSRLGAFEVTDTGTYSKIFGEVRNAILPAQVPEIESVDGDCRLIRRPNPFCDPPCGGDQTCSGEGECIPYPASLDLGRVQLRGLASCYNLEPRSPGNTYFAVDVPHPAAPAGQVVELAAPAASIGAMSLHGIGVESLPVGNPDFTVRPGEPLPVSWPTPADATHARITFSVNVDQHGIAPVTIQCDTADDGALEVPVSLIDLMFANGQSGFPSGTLQRRTVDSQAVQGGCVELLVASQRVADVVVED